MGVAIPMWGDSYTLLWGFSLTFPTKGTLLMYNSKNDIFNFENADAFALAEALKTLLVQLKESDKPSKIAISADDLAKFLVRWKEAVQKLSDEERSEEVNRVLIQLENLEKNLEKNYYDKKDMRFHFLVLGIISVLASMLGPEAMALLKYLISIVPK